MQTKIYREQHGRIRQQVRAMLALEHGAADAFELQMQLGRLAGSVKMHLLAEDDGLYPRLLQHQDERVRTKAAEFQTSMGTLASAFLGFVETWRESGAIGKDRAAFFRDLRGVADALNRRMDLEDNELYALADRELALA